MKRKILSFLIALVLMAGASAALFGCGGGETYDPDNFLPAGTAENPWQIVKEPVTLDIFVPRGGMNPPYREMKMFQKLSELTNLNFNFIEAEVSTYDNLRSTTWEDKNNLPDLFLFNNTVAEQVAYSQFGAFVAFNDDELTAGGIHVGNLIENYMPNYRALLDANFNIDTETDAKKVATLDDGYMYSTLSVNDVPRDLTFKMFINQQWIDNINEDYPDRDLPDADEIATVEQYIEVLRAFKECDPNRNGKNDEVPVTAKSMEYLSNFILAAYGYVSSDVEVKNDGSGLVYTPVTEAYQKYLETVRMMYQEGLLDNQVFSITTDSQMAVKGYAGRLGSFCAAAAYITVGMDLEDQYVTFGPLTSEYYTGEPLQWGFSNFTASGATIPTGTPYVREVARLLDIMYSELGTQLIAYGMEGEDWTWDDEAHTSWTFHVPADWAGTQEEYRATITPNVGTASALYWSYDFVGKMNDPIITDLNRMSERYMPYLKLPVPEELKFANADEYTEVSRLRTNLDLYVRSSVSDFVRNADQTVAEGWQSYVDGMKGYNYERLLGIYEAAYQRYLQGR